MTRNLVIAIASILATTVLLTYVWVVEKEGMAVRAARIEGQQLAKGAFDYESNCARCHGLTGEGISGTRINFLYVKREDGTEEGTLIEEGRWYGTNQVKEKYGTLRNYIEATATSGIRETDMLVWSHRFGGPLRDDQIKNIATYVMSWQGEIPDGAADSALDYQAEEIAKVMEGDDPIAVGEAVYQNICSSCHNLDSTTRVGPGQGGLFAEEGTTSFGTMLPNGEEITYETFRDWVHKGSLGYQDELIDPIKPYWASGKKRTIMTPFPTIDDKALVALIAYMSQFDRDGNPTLPVLGPDLEEWPVNDEGDLEPLTEFLDEDLNIVPEVLR